MGIVRPVENIADSPRSIRQLLHAPCPRTSPESGKRKGIIIGATATSVDEAFRRHQRKASILDIMMSQVRKLNIVTDFRDNTVGMARGGKVTRFGEQTFRKSTDNKSLLDCFALRARNDVLFRSIHNSHLFLKNGTFGRSQNLGMFKSNTRKYDKIATGHRSTV